MNKIMEFREFLDNELRPYVMYALCLVAVIGFFVSFKYEGTKTGAIGSGMMAVVLFPVGVGFTALVPILWRKRREPKSREDRVHWYVTLTLSVVAFLMFVYLFPVTAAMEAQSAWRGSSWWLLNLVVFGLVAFGFVFRIYRRAIEEGA